MDKKDTKEAKVVAAKAAPASTPVKVGESSSGLDEKAFKPFKVKKVKQVSPDTHLFTFEVPIQGEVPVSSFIVTRQTIDGKEEKRPYTPINTADGEKNGEINLMIKSYPTGKASKQIGQLSVGDSLELMGPIKKKPWVANEYKQVAFIAGGTGVTPMLQIIKKVLANPADKTKLQLVFANRTPQDILLRDEIDALAKAHGDQFQVTYILSKPSNDWKGLKGRITEDLVKKQIATKVPPSKESLVYVCGPPGFMDAVSGNKAKDYTQGELSGFLKAAGYESSQVFKF